MEDQRFDAALRALSRATTRRGGVNAALGVLFGGVAGSAAASGRKDPGLAGPCGDGQKCDKDRDCCTNFCIDGRCRCAPPGEACTKGDHCCSGTCARRVCEGGCRNEGTRCRQGVNCCSGTCKNGACTRVQEKRCSVKTCPDGCCDGDACKRGTTNNACGTGGAACAACTGGKTCQSQRCRASGGCSAATCPNGCCDGSTCKGGNSDNACGTGGAACASCTGGKTCQNGTCQNAGPSCSAATCANGCCDGSTCVTATDAAKCGTGGAACAACTGGTPVCASGVCAACAQDSDCGGLTPFCVVNACVECTVAADCGDRGDACTANACACGAGDGCSGSTPICCTQTCSAGASWNATQTITQPVGGGAGEWGEKYGVVILPDGKTLFDADYDNSRIDVWTRASTSGSWTKQTTFDVTSNTYPVQIAASSNGLMVWVTGAMAYQVDVWSRPDAASTNWTLHSSLTRSTGPYLKPYGVWVSGDTLRAYVAEQTTDNAQVTVWSRPSASSTEWTLDYTVGTYGTAADQLKGPRWIWLLDDELSMWVTDLDNYRVSVWTRADTSTTTWTHQSNVSGANWASNDDWIYSAQPSSDGLRTYVGVYLVGVQAFKRTNATDTSWTLDNGAGFSNSTLETMSLSADGLTMVMNGNTGGNAYDIVEYRLQC